MKTAKVFTACALGSFIGSLTALNLEPPLWWLGLIIGGFVGYLSYEAKKLPAAIKIAGLTAWRARTWRLLKSEEDRRIFRLGFNVGTLVFLDFAIFFMLPVMVFGWLTKGWVEWQEMILLSNTPLVVGLAFGVAEVATQLENSDARKRWHARLEDIILTANPLRILSWLSRGVWIAIRELGKASWKGMRSLPFFAWESILLCGRLFRCFFLLIHSDIRLLCGVDAAIGALVGFKTGSPIVGAIAGGVIGVVNYHLVTVRLLNPYLEKIKAQ